jgi:hypothetical protein
VRLEGYIGTLETSKEAFRGMGRLWIKEAVVLSSIVCDWGERINALQK